MTNRFYTLVSTENSDGGYRLLLDGKPVKTDSGSPLLIPVLSLANAVMKEWSAQVETIKPETMPLTQYLMTAQDRIKNQRDDIHRAVMAYIDTDLLCYRIDQDNALSERQNKIWGPVLKWCEDKSGIAPLTTTGLSALTQPEKLHDVLENYLDALDDLHFCVAQNLTNLGGSVLLTWAFMEQALDSETFLKVIFVEEDYKGELYNEDFYGRAPSEEKTREAVLRDVNAAKELLDYLAAVE